MSFSINMQELRERAAKRVATLANAANRLPDPVSQLATVAAIAEHSAAWTDDDVARFTARRDRLLRWGWTESEAERLAERLTLRDREGDERVSCTDCAHYRPHSCGNHEAAHLQSRDVGRDMAALLQRCPGHQP